MEAWSNVEAPPVVDLRMTRDELAARKRLVFRAWMSGQTVAALARTYGKTRPMMARWIREGMHDCAARDAA